MTKHSALLLALILGSTFSFITGQKPAKAGTDAGCDYIYPFEDSKWHATLNTEFKAGSRQISQLGFMLPVRQTEDSMFFVDFRGWLDDDHNDEYNVGLAYRRVLEDKIVGFYGFFDRHFSHATRNRFDQVTVGAEILGNCLDHRINAYIPTSLAGKSTGTSNVSIVGNRIYLSGLEQRAYWGFDYEVGKLLTCFGKNSNEVRLYGGAYYFTNDAAAYQTIAGPRLRLETRLFDVSLLGEASRVTVSGEVQWDEVRETQAFAGIQIQIPLGKFGSSGWTGGTPFGANNAYNSLSRLERRMYDPIVRDIDVVTNGSGPELANDAENDLLFVAFDGPGIDTEITNAAIDGTVIASGTMTTAGNHQLLAGQRIAGGNSRQTLIGSSTGRSVTANLPGKQGILNSSNPLNPVIQLADRNIVDSLHINGGLVGISGGSVSNTSIINNQISGAILPTMATPGGVQGSGIGLTGSFSGLIADNVIQNNASNGIRVDTNNGTITRNRTLSNQDDGIDVLNHNNGMITYNTSTNDMDESIDVQGDNNGSINYNQSTGAGDNGIAVAGNNNGSINYNTVMNAASFGIELEQNNLGTVDNNISNGNLFGIFMESETVSSNLGSISNNITNGNQVGGIIIDENRGQVANNTANNNTFVGIFIGGNAATGTASNNTTNSNGIGFENFQNDGVISNNTATSNTDVGFFLGINNGSIINNTANSNLAGFDIDENNGVMSGNTANFNSLFGFGFDSFAPDNLLNAGQFNNNTADNNLGAGFRAVDAGGTASGNSGTGNGAPNSGGVVP